MRAILESGIWRIGTRIFSYDSLVLHGGIWSAVDFASPHEVMAPLDSNWGSQFQDPTEEGL